MSVPDTTQGEYLAYILTLLQAEPQLPKPMVMHGSLPADVASVASNAYVQQWCRITKCVAIDSSAYGADDKAAVESLFDTYANVGGDGIVQVYAEPYDLLSALDPDDRLDLLTPMNADSGRQIDALSDRFKQFYDNGWAMDSLVNAIVLKTVLWPYPAEGDDDYGNGTLATKIANRKHRYQSAYELCQAYCPAATVMWYDGGPSQAKVGDNWNTVYARYFSYNNMAAIADVISPVFDRTWDDTWMRADSSRPARWALDYKMQWVPFLPIWASMPKRNPEDGHDADRTGDSFQSQYWTASTRDYNRGAFAYRPSTRGTQYAYLNALTKYVGCLTHPWSYDPAPSTEWLPEYWRRFLMLCRGARGAATTDLEAPDHTNWGVSYPDPVF